MAGRNQKAIAARDRPSGWQAQFAQLGRSRKLTCLTCGTTGYQVNDTPAGWQLACLIGHPETCEACGARFVKGGLHKHLRCRSGHSACPQHVDTQYRRMRRMEENRWSDTSSPQDG